MLVKCGLFFAVTMSAQFTMQFPNKDELLKRINDERFADIKRTALIDNLAGKTLSFSSVYDFFMRHLAERSLAIKKPHGHVQILHMTAEALQCVSTLLNDEPTFEAFQDYLIARTTKKE